MDAIPGELVDRVRAAAAAAQRLCIRGSGTKDFYGNAPEGDVLGTGGWSGIESYEPSELVITARAGTPLTEIEAVLEEQGQMLAFEPPHFGSGTTLGGCIAAGLAGPRRNAAGYAYGGVRDFVLGARLLDGKARVLRFGGTVIKNVAGYDVSRVLAGSMGILGVILDVSVKVLPRPGAEATLRFELDEPRSLQLLNQWGGQPLPVSASCWRQGELHVRLSGAPAALRQAAVAMGGEQLAEARAADLWRSLRDQSDPWFRSPTALWRISLPSTAAGLALEGEQTFEWGGALRWLKSHLSANAVRERAAQLGGHATLFRGGDRSQGAFTPLSKPLAAIHARLKDEFDPSRIFNHGRLFPDL